jgi:hypothetical protein
MNRIHQSIYLAIVLREEVFEFVFRTLVLHSLIEGSVVARCESGDSRFNYHHLCDLHWLLLDVSHGSCPGVTSLEMMFSQRALPVLPQ